MLRCSLSIAATLALAFAAHAASVVKSAKSGNWSDAATWDTGKVPAAGDKVLVRTGHTVTYDAKSEAVIRGITVSGTLTFAPDKDTLLNVGLIKIEAGDEYSEEGFDCDHAAAESKGERAALLVGTPERPIAKTALIRLHFVAGMNKESCPAIVCCGGRMDFHGDPMSRTWVKLGQTAKGFTDAFTLAEAPTGWKVGDTLLLTSVIHAPGYEDPKDPHSFVLGGYGEDCWKIKSIAGTRVTLTKPIRWDHPAEKGFAAEVANLSRNVVVESADRRWDGVRGHTMYHRHSAGSISYAEFRYLGKRDTLGRYALHFHLCGDTMRGSSVIGASIWNSNNRWLTVHGTNYLVVRDCVGYSSVGHGYFLEDGTEGGDLLALHKRGRMA